MLDNDYWRFHPSVFREFYEDFTEDELLGYYVHLLVEVIWEQLIAGERIKDKRIMKITMLDDTDFRHHCHLFH